MQKRTKRSNSRRTLFHSMSFATRMLILIFILLVLTTVSFMLVTQFEAKKTIERTINSSLQDMRELISLYVDNQYRSLIFHKENVLNRYKQQLKDLTDIAFANIEYYHSLAEKNILSEDKAKEFALRSIETFRYGNNDYYFVYDKHNVAISHPDPNVRGKNMTDYQDVKGNFAMRMIRETIQKKGSGYNSFWFIRLNEDKPIEKLTYSTYYKPWEWIVGTGFYIDDLEKDYQDKLNEMLSEFRKTFSSIRIGKNGYFFIFNSDHVILVHPTMEGVDFANVDVPGMGIEHWKALVEASKDPSTPYTYLWDKPGHEGQFKYKKVAYVDYFKPLNWYIVSTFYVDELNEPVKAIFRKELFTALAALLIAGLLTYFFVRRFTKPIKILTAHAQHLTSNNFVSDNNKELRALSDRSQDEMSNLADTFIRMEAQLQQYINDLKETTAAKEKIQSELRIAHEIQMGMLPKTRPDFAHANIMLEALLEPALEVGGDLYDYFFINDDHFCFLIGDVSDKGVPAALFMARSKSLIRATAMLLNNEDRTVCSSSKILEQVNVELCKDNTHCMFLTIILCIINTSHGMIHLSNAGHNPPLILDKKGIQQITVQPKMPIGIKTDVAYDDQSFTINDGASIYLYTDGITEAMDQNGALFGEKNLEKTLLTTIGQSPNKIISNVITSVRAFAGNTPQSDDITMLCLQYRPDHGKD